MASMEPSEEEISQVIDFAGLNAGDDRSMVIQALKNNNRNVETVVMQYFDNPENFRQKYLTLWNESMFSADRDGTANNSGISFHIESADQANTIQGVTPPPQGFIGAPSRPPSRSNDRSPLGRMIDWTASDAAGGSNIHSQEEDDMQRALRESAQEAGIALPQQESGITETLTATPHFGPATRTDYEQGDWAMVPVGTNETKPSDAPAPSLRKRAAEVPAFLVQAPNPSGSHRLGGLLTILHEIPLARNILLTIGSPSASYGFNSEWWRGQEILLPHVVDQLKAGTLQWGQQDQEKPGFEEEIHRLMAFLDSTERSFGSVGVLSDLVPYPSLGAEKQFYEQLGQQDKEKIDPLFQVATLATVHGNDMGSEDAKFGLLEVEHLRSDYVNIKTLYESLDYIMWNDALSWNEVHEGSKMGMFKEMGEVLAIKIGGDGPEDSIDIPAELYPEKYLASRKEEARKIQIAWCETKTALVKIAQEEQHLQEWKNDLDHISYDKKEMIQKIQNQWKAFGEFLESSGRYQQMEASGFDTKRYPDYRAAPCQMNDGQKLLNEKVEEVLHLSQRILSDMETRMEELRTQLNQIKAKQRFLGKLLTDPNKAGRTTPMTCNKYLLRGVATQTDVIYVCQRLVVDSNHDENKPEMVDQWWRLAYAANDDQPVKSEKTEIKRVLQEVWQETKTPLLVYATENALSVPRASLSDSLERFIRSDNRAFRSELSREASEASEVKKHRSIDPLSPSKRKHRSDSMDSMNSNRASLGSDDRNPFDNSPFEDQADSAGTELTEISMNKHSIDKAIDVDLPPPLPNREPAYTTNKSATLTPDTLPMEEDESDAHRGESQAAVSCIHDAKAPEMQERARPLTFIAVPSDIPEKDTQGASMDMDIPEAVR